VDGNIIFINDAETINIDALNENLRNSKIKAGEHNILLKSYIGIITNFAEEKNFYQKSIFTGYAKSR